MASSCISTCINDARHPVAVRPTYVNLYKWPESDAEFVRSRSSKGRQNIHTHAQTRAHTRAHTYAHARVVDSLSCRQMYLRSYTFSRKKERVHEKISRRVKERVKNSRNKRKGKAKNISSGNKSCVVKRKCVVLRKAKEASCAALLVMFRRLLSCTAKVDVAADNDHHHRHDQGHG